MTPAGRWLLWAAILMPVAYQLYVFTPGEHMQDRIAFLLGMGSLALMLYMGHAVGWLTWLTGLALVVSAIGAYAEITLVFRVAAFFAQLVIAFTWIELAWYWHLEDTAEQRITRVAAVFATIGVLWFAVVNSLPSGPWDPLMQSLAARVFGITYAEATMSLALWLSLAYFVPGPRRRADV